MISSEASWPSTLTHIVAPPRSAGFSSRAPCRPLSSRTVNSKVIGGMRQLVLEQGFDHCDEERDAGAGITAKRGGPVRDNAIALTPRLGARAQRHGVEMCRKKQTRPGPGSGNVDDQIARLGRQRDALVGVVEANGGRRHADLLQGVADGRGDIGFVSGDALDGEEPHQMLFRRRDIEWD